MTKLRFVFCLVVVLVLGDLGPPADAQGSFDAFEQQAINHINDYRAMHGCGPLSFAPEYQSGVESWVLNSEYAGQHRVPTPEGEIIAFVTDYSPTDEGAYEALHSFWKTSPPHNNILVGKGDSGGCYKFTRIAIAHALRTFSGSTKWLWVAELVKGSTSLPNISQVGRGVPSTYNPPLNGTVRFDVTLKNNSSYEAHLKEVFLRLKHTNNTIKQVPFWPQSNGTLVIPAGGTRTFQTYSPALSPQGAWEIEKIELQHVSGQWLPGIHQKEWLMVGWTNFAKNRPVYVHSVREGSGNVQSRVNDGLPNTRWESAWYDGQMIEIDLGQQRTINTIMLHWEGAYAKDYNVRMSSNNCGSNQNTCTWYQVYATANGAGNGVALFFADRSTRWIKVELNKRATPWGFSLWEIEAYRR